MSTWCCGVDDEHVVLVQRRELPTGLEFTQEMLALTDTEASEIGGLDVGESLWQIEIRGKMRSFLVEHAYSQEEWPLLQTNSKMLGQADTINIGARDGAAGREWGEVA